jgi:hypothetical protein
MIITTISMHETFSTKFRSFHKTKDAAKVMMELLKNEGEQYRLATTKTIGNTIQSASSEEEVTKYLDDGYAVMLQQGCSLYAHCESITVE